jgi:rifampicin phosphotransferase
MHRQQTLNPNSHATMVGFFPEVPLHQCGGKGRNLVQLAKASFPVPPGFIITLDAYSRFAKTGKDQIPGYLKKRISLCYRQLKQDTGSSLVAVRSSASAEDLAGTSFAGQYDTYLYVGSEEELFQRVLACWHSLFSERARVYRQRMNISSTGLAMAVIVQTMIPAKAAGILFTTYSFPGNPGEEVMVAESNWGCGETVVSGKATPDHFILSKQKPYPPLERIKGDKEVFLAGSSKGPLLRETPDRQRKRFSLTLRQLSQLAALGKKIEDYFAAPQDIEWALDRENRLFILQSRPITSI